MQEGRSRGEEPRIGFADQNPRLVLVIVRFVGVIRMIVLVLFLTGAMIMLVAVGVVMRVAMLDIAVFVLMFVRMSVLVFMFHLAAFPRSYLPASPRRGPGA